MRCSSAEHHLYASPCTSPATILDVQIVRIVVFIAIHGIDFIDLDILGQRHNQVSIFVGQVDQYPHLFNYYILQRTLRSSDRLYKVQNEASGEFFEIQGIEWHNLGNTVASHWTQCSASKHKKTTISEKIIRRLNKSHVGKWITTNFGGQPPLKPPYTNQSAKSYNKNGATFCPSCSAYTDITHWIHL